MLSWDWTVIGEDGRTKSIAACLTACFDAHLGGLGCCIPDELSWD